MKKQTMIDAFNEMGAAGPLHLLLFLAVLAYGCVIHFRELDQRWRKSFLLASILPIATGFCTFCYFFIDGIYQAGQGAVGLGSPADPLWILNEGISPLIRFVVWQTIMLLLLSAFLFITGKKESRDETTPDLGGKD